MIRASVTAQLITCPHCGIDGFTRLGLALHWCSRAPRLGGQQTKSRPLTGEECDAAVKRAQSQTEEAKA